MDYFKDKDTPVITFSLVAVNVIYFLYIELLGSSDDLYFMIDKGAIYAPLVIDSKEYWRLFTAMFMHFGVSHLGNNMFMLLVMGTTLEKAMGKIKYLLLYLLSGFGANVVSVYADSLSYNPPVSAGASGAIFGVVGALLWIVIANKGRFEDLSTNRMLVLLGLSLYFGFVSTGTDNIAHVSGAVIGFLLSLILYKKKKGYSNEYEQPFKYY